MDRFSHAADFGRDFGTKFEAIALQRNAFEQRGAKHLVSRGFIANVTTVEKIREPGKKLRPQKEKQSALRPIRSNAVDDIGAPALERLEKGRNFANKLWNIGQFVLGQLPKSVPAIEAIDRRSLTLADRWILSRAQATIREATASLEQFRLDEAAKRCFEFAWNELADWYVEAVKPRMTGDGAATPQAVLAYCLDVALRLLHPVVPFITEELWQKLPGRKAGELLIVAPWPAPRGELEDPRADQEFGRVKTAIEHIRSIRAEYRVSPKQKLRATIVPRGSDTVATFDGERDTIVRLAQLEALALDGAQQGVGAHAVFGDGSEVVVALEGIVDVSTECRRLSEEYRRLDTQLQTLSARLTNASFVSRAPQDVVAKEREKEKAWRDQRDVLAGKLKSLGCS